MSVTDCIFESNSCQDEGGAIWGSAALVISGCTFDSNEASGAGGAVRMRDYSNQTLLDSVFVNNTAYGNGGGLYLSTLGGHTVADCVFSGNTADQGGGVYFEVNSGDVTMSNTVLCANATELGGAEGSAVMRQASSTHLSRAARHADGSGAVHGRIRPHLRGFSIVLKTWMIRVPLLHVT